MKTIKINTHDPEARFDMNKTEAKEFFKFVEKNAIENGYEVEYVEAISTDKFSENFVDQLWTKF